MHIKTKSGRKVYLPTPKEGAAIDAGIAADPDNPPWTPGDFASARAASVALPELLGEKIAAEMLRPRGRPRLERTKERINIRLSPEVLAYFRAQGAGWQSRMDSALRQFVARQTNS